MVYGVLLGEYSTRGDIVFLYDESGALYGFTRGGTYYYYAFNGQGDVIGMYDQAGDIVAKYSYDTWGAPRTITDGSNNDVSSDATHIANINPIRYRGYYYDTDTGFYYLQSRYYDPIVGRFINADTLFDDGAGLLSGNLFAYCANNPGNCFDDSGFFVVNLFLPSIKSCLKPLVKAIKTWMAQVKKEKAYVRFLDGISSFESANAGNYHAVNKKSGALGRYQVLPHVLHSYSEYQYVSAEQFLNDPEMQERFIRVYHAKNWKIIVSMGLDKLTGTTFEGILITDAGLLAAAGYGAGNLKKVLNGNSTAHKAGIIARLKYFVGYDVSLITGR